MADRFSKKQLAIRRMVGVKRVDQRRQDGLRVEVGEVDVYWEVEMALSCLK